MDSGAVDHIVTFLRDRYSEMLDMLEAFVEIETPSLEPACQEPFLKLLSGELEKIGYFSEIIPGQGKSGGHLYGRPLNRKKGNPLQMLLGHCDTVWPLGTIKNMPFVIENDRVMGPGVFDMKGGLVQMIFALQAFHEIHGDPAVTPVIFINSDEEIGSRESRRYIERLARRVCRAYVLEPSLGLDGRIKTRRKGGGIFTISVFGKSAHAGLAPEEGASAIIELAYVVQQLHALNDPATGITVNVGQIAGGMGPNVVAAESKAVADVRTPTIDDARRIQEAIFGIKPSTPGTRIEVSGGFGRPPMEKTERNEMLWLSAKDAARQLDLDLQEGLAGGGSDGSYTNRYTATLDGLGAVGDGAHATHEFMFLDKIVERTALLTLLLSLPRSLEMTAEEGTAVAEEG